MTLLGWPFSCKKHKTQFYILPPEIRCSCAMLYNGSRCEKKVNPCASHACAKGLCVSNTWSYICNCSEQMTGNRWESHNGALVITNVSPPCVLGEVIEKSDRFVWEYIIWSVHEHMHNSFQDLVVILLYEWRCSFVPLRLWFTALLISPLIFYFKACTQ